MESREGLALFMLQGATLGKKGWNSQGRNLDLTQLINTEHLLGFESSCVCNSHKDSVGQRSLALIQHLQRPRYRDENHTAASMAEPPLL